MIRESDIQERLNRNKAILQEAEQDRLARLATNRETRPNLIRLALEYLGRIGLVRDPPGSSQRLQKHGGF